MTFFNNNPNFMTDLCTNLCTTPCGVVPVFWYVCVVFADFRAVGSRTKQRNSVLSVRVTLQEEAVSDVRQNKCRMFNLIGRVLTCPCRTSVQFLFLPFVNFDF